MKNTAFVKCLACLLSAAAVLSAFGCKKDNEPGFSKYNYIENSSSEPTDTDPSQESEPSSPANEELVINSSWKTNYSVVYKYYDSEQSVATASAAEPERIRESLCNGFFIAEYPRTGNFVYYEANGSDLECYIAAPDENKYLHSVVKNKTIYDLDTTFMKLTLLSPDFPTLPNVMLISSEEIAGRPCKKYIQRAYTNTAVTDTVYVWADDEYGFVMKCEAYNAADELNVYWEVTEFAVGGVQAEDIKIDLSEYSFTDRD